MEDDSNAALISYLAVARVQADACGLPVRSRKVDTWACLVPELLALACLAVRMYSRYYTTSKFELDDYVMASVAVGASPLAE